MVTDVNTCAGRCLEIHEKHPDLLREKMMVNELSLLLSKFNETFRHWLGSFFIVTIAGVIFNAAGAVALLRIRMLIIALICSALLLYCCNRCATVYEQSQELTSRRQSQVRIQWLAKSWNAWRPLQFHVGPFLYADRELGLNMLSFIITNTAVLLIEARLLR